MTDPIESYRSLDEDAQRILRVFAVIDEPITQTTMKSLLDALGWRNAHGGKLSATISKPLRERLLELGLLESHRQALGCHRKLLHPLTRQCADDGTLEAILAAAERVAPSRPLRRRDPDYEASRRRRMRNALYRGDESAALKALGIRDDTPEHEVEYQRAAPLTDLVMACGDLPWLTSLGPRIRVLGTAPALRTNALVLMPACDPALMEQLLTPIAASHDEAANALAELYLLGGRPEAAAAVLGERGDPRALALRGWAAFDVGDHESALHCFDASVELWRRQTRKRRGYVRGLPGVLELCARLLRGGKTDLAIVDERIGVCSGQSVSDPLDAAFRMAGELGELRSGRSQLAQSYLLADELDFADAHTLLFQALFRYWSGEKPSARLRTRLAENLHSAVACGMLWLAHQSAELLRATGAPCDDPVLAQAPEAPAPLAELLAPRPDWETRLEALQRIASATGEAPDGGEHRLVWMARLVDDMLLLHPREQKRTKAGKWTKGRVVSLQRLATELDDFPYLSAQDREICACIEHEHESGWYGRYGRDYYTLNEERAAAAAVGHPLLFWETDGKPVELVPGQPTLSVVKRKGAIHVSLEPPVDAAGTLSAVAESPQRIRLYRLEPAHREVAGVLGRRGIRVPKSAEPRLLKSLGSLAPLIAVHSDLAATDGPAETRDADPHLHVHITPLEAGMQMTAQVHPLGDHGPHMAPGTGRATLMTGVDGRTLRCTRDLDAELERARLIPEHCPLLEENPHSRWDLDDPELALGALEQLQALGDAVTLDWPKGQRIALTKEAGIQGMCIGVSRKRDWLAVDGSLTLDDGRVLALEELLALTAESAGRFIRLDEHQVLVLEKALRRRLDGLRGLTDQGRFHPLAAPAIAELVDGMALERSPAWTSQLRRLDEARALEPTPPSTLQAQLRDYQADGYRWLMRLAHWGAGACLADDMGLGKTVQALGVILSRAPDGPTLVLAPTSVCGNWIDEARRFAPTLRPIRFGPGDRAAVLDAAGPFDLIVCSYGLLQTEGKRLAGIDWTSIVADEAQAFKNPRTRRSQAVMRLRGGLRMITTGTPIENHLGELWNLFRFINPGLLGSEEVFRQRFGSPIEEHKDRGARERLRQLIRPFILRRLKSEVLDELPPRTEITLRIELSDAEAALYEALRRQAVERVEDSAQEANPGAARMRLLAEIMRLRRACCHPRLVLDDSTLPGSKLAAFHEIADELRENDHKALVFSQFVDHLALIRADLDAGAIPYQYLDGSTPEPKRRKAIAEFQAGSGELFLISLRAGGAGLNLTAADYVIHMDPWWNPAVEDQASGRAHRIGQTRPVTVYRLVAKGTIEEAILELHASKRELADGLLEGTEDGGRLSYEAMLALVKGAAGVD